MKALQNDQETFIAYAILLHLDQPPLEINCFLSPLNDPPTQLAAVLPQSTLSPANDSTTPVTSTLSEFSTKAEVCFSLKVYSYFR